MTTQTYQVLTQSGASPIDAGYGLVHADTIVATTEDILHTCPPSSELRLTVGDRTTLGPVTELGLGAGKYEGRLVVRDGGVVTVDKPVSLILIPPARVCRRFGARHGALAYDLPVIAGREAWSGGDRKVPWSSLWKTGDCPDIVVDFEAPYKFVLWRGMAYAPSWAMNNVMTSNFFAETLEPGIYRDCCEMMSDRECRYSHARVIHSSAARVVIHWRYALCDAAYAICRDYWADEMFFIYPDGVAVRNVTLHLDPRDEAVWQVSPGTGRKLPCSMINGPPGKRTFNDMEFITVNPAGATSDDTTPLTALTLLDSVGYSRNYQWPKPDFDPKASPILKDYIFRLNYRNRQATFLASPSDGLQFRLQANTGARYEAGARVEDDRWVSVSDLPTNLADHVHWPVTRGYGTTPLTDTALYADRPTHTFLGYANNTPVEVREDGAVTWSWLCGMAPPDDNALRALVSAWTTPPAIAGCRYNCRERAYELECANGHAALAVQDRPVTNPTFLLPGVEAATIEIRVNHTPVKHEKMAMGLERTLDMQRTVVTLSQSIPPGSTINIEWSASHAAD